MKKKITYFETTKDNHTLETFVIVEQKLRETGIRKIILASTTGRTALKAMEYYSGKGITLMAADGGLVKSGESVIAVAGTGANSDTALVMQASNTRNLNKLRVNEILCKPYNAL